MASVPRSFGMCFINEAFQNASAQCALKAAIPTSGPLYSNAGMPHLMFSPASGHAAWTDLRMRLSIGLANGCAFAM